KATKSARIGATANEPDSHWLQILFRRGQDALQRSRPTSSHNLAKMRPVRKQPAPRKLRGFRRMRPPDCQFPFQSHEQIYHDRITTVAIVSHLLAPVLEHKRPIQRESTLL